MPLEKIWSFLIPILVLLKERSLWRFGSKKMITLRRTFLNHWPNNYSDSKVPWNELPDEIREFILYGDPKRIFELKLQIGRGKAKKAVVPVVFADLKETMWSTSSEGLRAKLLTCQIGSKCEDCKGGRLSSLQEKLNPRGLSFDTFLKLSAKKHAFVLQDKGKDPNFVTS